MIGAVEIAAGRREQQLGTEVLVGADPAEIYDRLWETVVVG
ncbi:hypothetical protein [Micromonospora okii]|nr:hypothetical protein [Micromonospora okii]